MRQMAAMFALLSLSLLGVRPAKADPCNNVPDAVNLIVNCGFETGDFTGWGGTAPGDPNFLATGVGAGMPFEGSYEADLAPPAPGDTLTQTFMTTPGAQLILQFELMKDNDLPPDTSNFFSATLGDTMGFYESDVNSSHGYVMEGFTAIATGTMTTLTFTVESPGDYFELDSVSVTESSTVNPPPPPPPPPPPSTTPEPSTFVLLGTGLAGLLGRRFLRRQ